MADFMTEDGSVIVYSDHGAGIPVLFLHGWMMSRRVWSFQEPLSGLFRVITIELRGHGDSLAPEFSYDNCINDISELLAHLNIDGVVLVGWSMGAQIAICVSSVMSRKVAGMILVGGTPCFCKKADYDFGVSQAEVRSMVLRLKKNYKSTAGEFFKAMFSDGEISKTDMITIAHRAIGRLPDCPVAMSALKALTDSDLRSLLPGISVPVLLVHGVDDRICPPGASEYMASIIPAATIELIERRGHAPFLSCPEKFNSLLADFVRSL